MNPLRYLTIDSDTGCRIGGACPRGLETELKDDATQYFGTFPLPGEVTREFSVFHRFDPLGNDPDRDMITFNNQVLSPRDLIWVVVHEISTRSATARSAFAGLSLVVETETPDRSESTWFPDVPFFGTGEFPYSGSKLGGRCFIDRVQVRDEVLALEAAGFVHLLQICDETTSIIRGFPWDPGSLNVWAANPVVSESYRFCVQQ